MEVKTEICDGYVVTIVDGKVFSVKPLPSPNSEPEPKSEEPVKKESVVGNLFDAILDDIEAVDEERRKKRDRFRKAWGYGSHWYKDYVA